MDTRSSDGAQLDHILDLIYDAVEDPAHWRAVLEEMRSALGADGVVAVIKPDSVGRSGLSLALTDRLYEFKDFLEALRNAPPFPCVGSHEVVSIGDLMSKEEWCASSFYRDVCAPMGFGDILRMELRLEDKSARRFYFMRGVDVGPFGPVEHRLAKTLAPHLRRALRLDQHLARTSVIHRRYVEACERMGVATFILDTEARVLECNARAKSILSRSDGLRLHDGKLRALHEGDNRKLQNALKLALGADTSASGGRVLPLHRSGSGNLHVLVQPVDDRDSARAGLRWPAAIVFIRDPALRAGDVAQVVRELFELTHSEAALLTRLVNGQSLPDAAADMQVRDSTARTHLRAIFAKTGQCRQSSLIRQVLNSVTMLTGESAIDCAPYAHAQTPEAILVPKTLLPAELFPS